MATINKFLIQVHTNDFGWQKFESCMSPDVDDGWMRIHLLNGTHVFQLSKVNQYTITYELKE